MKAGIEEITTGEKEGKEKIESHMVEW